MWSDLQTNSFLKIKAHFRSTVLIFVSKKVLLDKLTENYVQIRYIINKPYFVPRDISIWNVIKLKENFRIIGQRVSNV